MLDFKLTSLLRLTCSFSCRTCLKTDLQRQYRQQKKQQLKHSQIIISYIHFFGGNFAGPFSSSACDAA